MSQKSMPTIDELAIRAGLNAKQKNKVVHFAEYLLAGGAQFWVGYFWLLIADGGLHWSLWWSKLSANLIGLSISFVLQRNFTFSHTKTDSKLTNVTAKYFVVMGMDFVIDYFIVQYTLGLSALFSLSRPTALSLGQFISAGFFTVWNYFWFRWWVFTEVSTPKALKHPTKED
jgi:putative flippase GtrA